MADLILEELENKPTAEWSSVLERFSETFQVEFALFRNDGAQLAGSALRLPEKVRARLTEPIVRIGPGPPQRRFLTDRPPAESEAVHPETAPQDSARPGDRDAPPGPAERDLMPRRFRGGRDFEGGPGFGRRPLVRPRGPYPTILMHTAEPTRYWMLVRVVLPDPDRPRFTPATLVAISPTMSAGGLFFDVRPWLAVGIGVVVFSVLFWFPLMRGITRSLGQMTQATRQIADGRFDARVDESRRDELGSLGQSVNQMAGRLEGFVAGQKRFLGDIAHELCSPLARLRVALGILEQRAGDQQQTYVQVANEKAEQMANLINELLSFSKASMGHAPTALQPVSLRDVAEKAVQREVPEGVPVQTEVPDGFFAQAEPELLMRALSNLLRNAVRYAGEAGPISVMTRRDHEHVELVVADGGPGIPAEELAKVFDPFYRVDVSRDRETGGAGLGLAIVKTCVESCGGTVTCRNRQPTGLEVVIRLRAAR